MLLKSKCAKKQRNVKPWKRKKKIEKEEAKYHSEIEKAQEALNVALSDDEKEKLQERILELQSQLLSVIVKKVRLQTFKMEKPEMYI